MTDHSKRHETEDDASDDIDAYVATFSEEEQADLAAAEEAIGITIQVHRAQELRGSDQ
jgi:hypothetical protein